MGPHPAIKLPGGPLVGPTARQGEFSSSEQLNGMTSKIDVLGPEEAEGSPMDNPKSLKGSEKSIFGQRL